MSIASVVPLLREADAADLELACGEGFDTIAETTHSVVCRRTQRVDSAVAAESLSRQWGEAVVCYGQIDGLQSSISAIAEEVWQVSVRYTCEG